MTLENNEVVYNENEGGPSIGGVGNNKKMMLDAASLLALFPKEEIFSPGEVPNKKSKYGRPKKQPAFSSFRCYEERDVEFFIHQVTDNEAIYDRKNSLNFDAGYIHATFDKIESSCQFLSRKNGENAARLWTELASEYKREKARLENLPSGAYTRDFEPKFPFLQQMWFLEQEPTASGATVDFKIHNETIQDQKNVALTLNGNGDTPTPPIITSRKRQHDGRSKSSEASSPAAMNSIEKLDESINRLIEVMTSSKKEQKEADPPIINLHSDLIDHILRFFENIPKEKHLEIKCKLFMFLEKLKT